MVRIGIIGGSGLEDSGLVKGAERKRIETEYGSVHAEFGKISGVEAVLLSRHGKGHTVTPTNVNYRANMRALKEAGCTHCLATTAVGSLREEIRRGDFVIPDQFIDFTRHRPITFYEEFEPGKLAHAQMADPFDGRLRKALVETCKSLDFRHHERGTVVTIEGPRFSTRAESMMFRQWGADVINMTTAPEAILAKEAGLPYATVAMSTDYDCWKEDEKPVSWEAVREVLNANADKVMRLLAETLPKVEKL